MFGLSVASVFKHWDYKETLQDLSALLRANISEAALKIEFTLKQEYFADARMYLDIAKSHHYKINTNKYIDEIERKDTGFNRFSSQVADFSIGFLQLKPRA